MKEKEQISRQQQKSRETKEKIFKAAKRILQKGGYEELSIKNICEEAGVSNGVQAVKDGIIQVYLNYVKYCRELGVEFMSGYYDTKNQALNADIRTERPYPIVTVRAYVEKAVQAGVAVLNEPIEEFTTDIRMIVIGNVFEWCIKHGKADFEGNMSRSLRCYLDGALREAVR